MAFDSQLEADASIDVLHDVGALAERYRDVRQTTEVLCEPLEVEDYCIQSMPDASPTKWHLAHTSWFFETFVIKRALPSYRSPHAKYDYLFNSYYNSVGRQHSRNHRGMLSRPTVAEVMDYRAHVDQAMGCLLEVNSNGGPDRKLLGMIETGLHHEQQHQELMLMDIKHVFHRNPLHPAYQEPCERLQKDVAPLGWVPFEGRLEWIGHDGGGFAFDNELPRHRTYVESYQIADRLITCGEYLEFVEDGGYARPELWLADGWASVQAGEWAAPLYWQRDDGCWRILTLEGMRDLDPSEPVCHVSYYEADAFARWMRCWLPRESAWEAIASQLPIEGNFAEQERFHPAPAQSSPTEQPLQMFGDLWEWTCSSYSPYPGYRPPAGAVGEYNGKFMCNQMVLRGGACVTPRSHIRATYRNFFGPNSRWPFTGIRLAKELT